RPVPSESTRTGPSGPACTYVTSSRSRVTSPSHDARRNARAFARSDAKLSICLVLPCDSRPLEARPVPPGLLSHRCGALRDLAQRLSALAHELLRDAGKRRQGDQPAAEALHHRQIVTCGTLTLVF